MIIYINFIIIISLFAVASRIKESIDQLEQQLIPNTGNGKKLVRY